MILGGEKVVLFVIQFRFWFKKGGEIGYMCSRIENCIIIGKAHFAVVGNVSHKVRDFYFVYVEPSDAAAAGSNNCGEEYRCTKEFYEAAILGGHGYSVLFLDSSNYVFSGNILYWGFILIFF